MGEFKDKAVGQANTMAGKVKRAAGEALDRPDLVAEGGAQEAGGHVRKAVGSVKGALKQAIDKA